MPAFYGEVKTNLGQGLIFELIRDYDGNISRNLDWYLEDESRTPEAGELVSQLRALRRYLLEERIIARDLKAANILPRRLAPAEMKWVVADGLGNNEFIPIAEYVDWLGRRKILRKWNGFVRGLERRHGGNGKLKQALREHGMD